SGWFDHPATRQFLAQQGFVGIHAARFFSNALTTRTEGIEGAAGYRFGTDSRSLRLTASVSHNASRVSAVDSLKGVLSRFQETFFDRVERARIELGQPRD